MLLQSIYYGSFRYWLFSMVLPPKVSKLIEEDARQLLWASNPDLVASEDGTDKNVAPYINAQASHRSRKTGDPPCC